MNLLIIGAGGFIGSHLSDEILANHRDWRITAIDLDSTKVSHLLDDENFNFIKCDILRESDVVDALVEACDVALPLAAIANPAIYVTDPLRIFELDFEANLNIIKMCVKYGKRVIFPSTSEVYGMCDDEEFDDETSNCVTGPICKQRWIYSCSKQMLDRVIYAHGLRGDLRYTLFRPFNWIGPRLDDIFNEQNASSRVVTQFLSNVFHGKKLNLVDGGLQRRCFIDISDSIHALINIIENENNCAENQIFNIGNPCNELSMKDLAYQIVDLAKSYDKLRDAAERIEISVTSASEYYGKSYQDVTRRVPSIKKTKLLLKWAPKVSFRESLVKIMDFYFK